MLNDAVRMLRAGVCAAVMAAIAWPGVLLAQKGSLTGQVLSATGEKPVANAEVIISDLSATVRTDSLGRFVIEDIPAGKHHLTVRHIGFQPYVASLVFKGKDKVEADFLLDAVTTLATVDVRAEITKRHAARLVDFDQRRKEGFGKFLGREFFEKNEMQSFGTLLSQRFGTLRAHSMQGNSVAATSRGNSARPCPVQVFLNGLAVYNGEMVYFDLSIVQTSTVLGVEFYTPLYTPVEFMKPPRGSTGGSGCGTLMIWTM